MTIAAQPIVALEAELAEDGPAVEALIAAAFGPGRFVKTAQRLRETNRPAPELSFVARRQNRLQGCVRLWPIVIGQTPALFLGPIAVDAACRDQGLGLALVRHACEAASAAGHKLVLLVGDEPFFARAGFTAAAAQGVVMPGPVDQRRVLLRTLTPGADAPVTGLAKPASW